LVDRQALVGEYRLDPETRNWYSKEIQSSVPAATLRLSADGRFIVRNMPDCLRGAECRPGTVSFAGTWEPEKLDDSWVLALHVSDSDHTHGYFTTAQLRSQQPPYIVHFIVGDPDSGRAIAFERGHG
jgi:hypothetical protein